MAGLATYLQAQVAAGEARERLAAPMLLELAETVYLAL
tara:strand:- start:231 stop:344 length:114 start_codon:yes stop_codon:yes gene_type:complete